MYDEIYCMGTVLVLSEHEIYFEKSLAPTIYQVQQCLNFSSAATGGLLETWSKDSFVSKYACQEHKHQRSHPA